MGFSEQLRDVLRQLPKERQTMLFSATFPPAIRKMAQESLKNPAEITVRNISVAPIEITQELVQVSYEKKNDVLLDKLNSSEGSALIFARTKIRADSLTAFLESYGVKVGIIHGGRSQGQRNRSLDDFRRGSVRVLVATDIASRGIDISHVAHVFNYDLPMSPEDYIHRIGRTGRAGKKGHALSFVTPGDHEMWNRIVRQVADKNLQPLERRAPGKSRPTSGGGGGPRFGGRGGRPKNGRGERFAGGDDRRSQNDMPKFDDSESRPSKRNAARAGNPSAFYGAKPPAKNGGTSSGRSYRDSSSGGSYGGSSGGRPPGSGSSGSSSGRFSGRSSDRPEGRPSSSRGGNKPFGKRPASSRFSKPDDRSY
jgi:superfamily II DNA/RNA helicase